MLGARPGGSGNLDRKKYPSRTILVANMARATLDMGGRGIVFLLSVALRMVFFYAKPGMEDERFFVKAFATQEDNGYTSVRHPYEVCLWRQAAKCFGQTRNSEEKFD